MQAPATPPVSDIQSPVAPGEIVAGKYRVEGVLGAGGMGVVVAATHLQLRELVAIKLLRPDVCADDAEGLVRFVREARVAAKIRSEHVARVFDVGTLESGGSYIVLEYLEGQDLEAWLGDSGKLPVERAVEYILQACEALAEAHAAGIVHRDIKPGNLFLASRADGSHCIKVLDFGISKVRDLSFDATPLPGASDAGAGSTTTDTMGSPPYLAPEQLSRGEVDARADIWALGATLYELLTGVAPFAGASLNELYTRILRVNPARISSLRPDVPAGLEAVVNRCLRKEASHRFADVAELAAALVRFGPEGAARSAERTSRVFETAGVPTSTRPPEVAPLRPRQEATTVRNLVPPPPQNAEPQRPSTPAGVLPEVDALLSSPPSARSGSNAPTTRDTETAEPELDSDWNDFGDDEPGPRVPRRRFAIGAIVCVTAIVTMIGFANVRRSGRPVAAPAAPPAAVAPADPPVAAPVPPPAVTPAATVEPVPSTSARARPASVRRPAGRPPSDDGLFNDRK